MARAWIAVALAMLAAAPAEAASHLNTWVLGINNAGQAVGFYQDATNTNHGYLYDNGVYTPLDVPGAGERPLDIGIQKERDTSRPVYLGAVDGPFRECVVGRVDPQRMAALLQRIHETQQGDTDPADHRPVDFRENGYAHGTRMASIYHSLALAQ